MFNLPWTFRQQTGLVNSKGPSFRWAPSHSFSLSGTQIKLKVPRNRYSVPVEVVSPPNFYDLEEGYGMSPWDGDYPLLMKVSIYRAYEFYGDFFTGSMGSIEFFGALYKPAQRTDGLNLFHPRALEGFISSYLTKTYSDQFSGGDNQKWHAPFDWCIQNEQLSIVRFEVRADPKVYTNMPYHSYLIFPVHKHYVFILRCEVERDLVVTELKPKPKIDEWIDPKPFQTFIDQIYSSVQVILSPKAEAQRQEAIAGLQDASLVKEFPPFNWQKKSAAEKKSLV